MSIQSHSIRYAQQPFGPLAPQVRGRPAWLDDPNARADRLFCIQEDSETILRKATEKFEQLRNCSRSRGTSDTAIWRDAFHSICKDDGIKLKLDALGCSAWKASDQGAIETLQALKYLVTTTSRYIEEELSATPTPAPTSTPYAHPATPRGDAADNLLLRNVTENNFGELTQITNALKAMAEITADAHDVRSPINNGAADRLMSIFMESKDNQAAIMHMTETFGTASWQPRSSLAMLDRIMLAAKIYESALEAFERAQSDDRTGSRDTQGSS